MKSFCIFSNSIEYKTYHSISEIDSFWDNFLPENHHLKSTDLKVLENAQLPHIQYKYLVIEDNKIPIGIAYLQLLNFNSSHYNNEILNKPKLEKIKDYILKKHTNVLICGNLFRCDFQGFYFKNAENKHVILDVVKHFAKKNEFKIKFTGALIKDCESDFDKKHISEFCYKPFADDIIMQLCVNNQWNSFEDYQNDLSRKYAQRSKKIRNHKNEIESKDLDLLAVQENATLLEKLYLNVASKQPIKMGVLNAKYFIEMKRIWANNFKVIGYYIEKELVAFSSFITGTDKLEIHYIGFDYAQNEKHKLYFNIIFDGLEMAIQDKKQKLSLGRTALEAKASAGAKPIYVTNYIWTKLGLPTLVYNFFNKYFKNNASNEWQTRHPFK